MKYWYKPAVLIARKMSPLPRETTGGALNTSIRINTRPLEVGICARITLSSRVLSGKTPSADHGPESAQPTEERHHRRRLRHRRG